MPARRERRWPGAFFVFFVAVFLDTLAAYNFSSIPVPWFSYAAIFFLTVFVAKIKKYHLSLPKQYWYLIVYIAFAILVNVGYLLLGFEYSMPSVSTTNYYLFIFIRFFVIFGFLLAFLCVYNLCLFYTSDKVFKVLESVLFIVILFGIYIYLAQIFGLWEPPRSRMGTGGQDFAAESVGFSYAFHRLLGTFREPSHFAEWVVGPLLIVLSISKSRPNRFRFILSILAIFCLILSGSLLGVLGFLSGMFVLIFFGGLKLSKNTTRIVLVTLIGSIAAIQIFNIDFFATIVPRMQSLFAGGVLETNRAYAWEYLFTVMPPIFGYGLGNSNIMFSEYLGSPLISSHISLFINAWFSLGVVGFILIVLFAVYPIFNRYFYKFGKTDPVALGCFAAIIAWIVFYLGHSEEISILHAIILGIFSARMKELKLNQTLVRYK